MILELVHHFGTLTVRGPQAVGTGVAAADDDHLASGSGDLDVLEAQSALLGPVGEREETPSPGGCPTAQRPGMGRSRAWVAPGREFTTAVEVLAQLLDGDVDPTFTFTRNSVHLGAHLGEAAVQDPLFHLELGDAVAQQSADAVGPFEHDHVVAGAGQLLRPRRARPGRIR